MSMLKLVGMNKQFSSLAYGRASFAVGLRSFHAGRPVAMKMTKPRSIGGEMIYPESGSYIKGTVNDSVEYPKPDPSHGSYHWAFERLLSVSLIPLISVACVKHGMSGAVDGILSAVLLLHSHIGFDNVFTDYVEKRKFPKAGPAISWILRGFTLLTGYGLYEFNTNDIGIVELVRRLWFA